jgi:EpsD family peptidyl-prolyl cis-trans isomerase
VRIVLLLLLLLPLGCQRADANRPGMRVVAKVNGMEISAAEMPSAQALDQVIERELLVQKALAAGLERDPRVAESIDNARRQLLAQAWVERLAAGARSTREEVRAFYAANPALFSARRIYRLRELTLAAPAELLDVLRAEAARAGDLDAVGAWLRARGAKFSVVNSTQPAEQLPLSHLPELARMKPGEIAVFAAPPGASVVQLLHAEDAPLSEAQAAPLIEQFLAGRKRLEIAAAEVKRLREVASIEYAGDFKARAR